MPFNANSMLFRSIMNGPNPPSPEFLARVGVVDGPPPTIETVTEDPSQSHVVNVSPYPDPYQMVIAEGQAQYGQPSMYEQYVYTVREPQYGDRPLGMTQPAAPQPVYPAPQQQMYQQSSMQPIYSPATQYPGAGPYPGMMPNYGPPMGQNGIINDQVNPGLASWLDPQQGQVQLGGVPLAGQYQCTGAMAGTGLYHDANQPTYTGLPIQNYSNPYMGIGQSYGDGYGSYYGGYGFGYGYGFYGQDLNAPPGSPNFVNILEAGCSPEFTQAGWMRKYMMSSPEDRAAMERGFPNAYEEYRNHVTVMMALSASNKKYLGYDDEYIQKNVYDVGAKQLEEFRNRTKNQTQNGLFVGQYQQAQRVEDRPSIHVAIMRGDTIEYEFDSGPVNPAQAEALNRRTNEFVEAARQNNDRWRINYGIWCYKKYATAPEREFDHYDTIDFFNRGLGYLHFVDRFDEMDKMARANAQKRTYDKNAYIAGIIINSGPPGYRRYFRDLLANPILSESQKSSILNNTFSIGADGGLCISVPPGIGRGGIAPPDVNGTPIGYGTPTPLHSGDPQPHSHLMDNARSMFMASIQEEMNR